MGNKETYKLEGHSFTKVVGGKKVCSRCGLVALNNKLSEWCVDKGCLYQLHSQYESIVKRLTKLF